MWNQSVWRHYLDISKKIRLDSDPNSFILARCFKSLISAIGRWCFSTYLVFCSELVWIDVGLFLVCSVLFLFLPKVVEKATNHSKWQELKKGLQILPLRRAFDTDSRDHGYNRRSCQYRMGLFYCAGFCIGIIGTTR